MKHTPNQPQIPLEAAGTASGVQGVTGAPNQSMNGAIMEPVASCRSDVPPAKSSLERKGETMNEGMRIIYGALRHIRILQDCAWRYANDQAIRDYAAASRILTTAYTAASGQASHYPCN